MGSEREERLRAEFEKFLEEVQPLYAAGRINAKSWLAARAAVDYERGVIADR